MSLVSKEPIIEFDVVNHPKSFGNAVHVTGGAMFGNGVKHFNCVDLHCEGEPARILTGGFPPVPGKSMSEKRDFIKNNLDHVPKLLLQVQANEVPLLIK